MPTYRATALIAPEAAAKEATDRLDAALAGSAAVGWSEVSEGTFAVEAYWADSEEPIASAARAALAEIAPDALLAVEQLPERDWVAESLAGLPPVVAGRFVVHGSHDRGRIPAGLVAIEVEAAEAFGSGHHGTTAGCLIALSRVMKRRGGRPFGAALDLGAGTGVLAIALARLTHRPVAASDIDPVSTAAVAANARLNRVAALVRPVTAVGFRHQSLRRRYDLVMANILAGPLVALAPEMRRRIAPGGTLILSGLLTTQARRVDAAYRAAGFRRDFRFHRDGWATLALRG